MINTICKNQATIKLWLTTYSTLLPNYKQLQPLFVMQTIIECTVLNTIIPLLLYTIIVHKQITY